MLNEINNCIYQGYKESNIRTSFTVKEEAKGAKCKEAKFKRTGDILIYKFDKTPRKNGVEISDRLPFFNDIPKVKSICDFIFFYRKSHDQLCIILCNLKSSALDNSPDQLSSGEIFANYIIGNVKRVYPAAFDNITINYYHILYSAKLLYKPTTNPRNFRPSNPRNFVSNDEQVDVCDLDNVCRH